MSLKASLFFFAFLSVQFYVLDAFIPLFGSMNDELDIFCRKNGVCTSSCGPLRCSHNLVTPSLNGSVSDETMVLFKARPLKLLGNSVVFSIFDSFVAPQILTYEDVPYFPIERSSISSIDTDELSSYLIPGSANCAAKTKPPISSYGTIDYRPAFQISISTGEGSYCLLTYTTKTESSRFEYVDLHHTSSFRARCDVCRHRKQK